MGARTSSAQAARNFGTMPRCVWKSARSRKARRRAASAPCIAKGRHAGASPRRDALCRSAHAAPASHFDTLTFLMAGEKNRCLAGARMTRVLDAQFLLTLWLFEALESYGGSDGRGTTPSPEAVQRSPGPGRQSRRSRGRRTAAPPGPAPTATRS